MTASALKQDLNPQKIKDKHIKKKKIYMLCFVLINSVLLNLLYKILHMTLFVTLACRDKDNWYLPCIFKRPFLWHHQSKICLDFAYKLWNLLSFIPVSQFGLAVRC